MRSYFFALIISCSILGFQTGCSDGTSSANTNTAEVQNAGSEDTAVPAAPTEFTSATEALAEGNRLFENGDTLQAIEVLNQAVKLDPDLAEAYFRLGVAYALIEAEDDTVSAEPVETPVKDAKAKKPKEVKKNSEIAFENAVKGYKKVLIADEENDVAHFNLGLAYNKLNEDEDAAKALREAVKLKPDDTQYQTELGAILIKLAKYQDAVAALKKAVELDPENSKAENLLEKAEAGKKRIDFVSVKKDDKNDKKEPDSADNREKETDVPASNKPAKPADVKAVKTPVPAKTPK